ncbi:insulinase family protein [Fulvivirga sp. M361]|uniref:M16 family metallopeptidase n=1 Tax=Fulvivirga sp. M361 TaxID=2594266 RepID=UPI00117B05F2|nr:M16 family metallopeptidase [Fulvivirga sp. M361]TRX53693.1 insulinase family protein [Fulvivirga sp. M361]
MRTIRILCILFFSFFITSIQAQKIAVELDLNIPLPVDSNVRIGKLDNGLTYYIRKNAKPENKVELRLVLDAGSMLEDESQRGLAHFLEHMAFNGTKNFEKNELVNYLQSVGVKFGADLNAYTSFDETVYILPIPSDDEEILNKGLTVLEDWAQNMLLDEEEIDKERGVVIEEWRLGQGADQRMRDQWFPVMFKDSRYADRLPIGTKETLETFKYNTLRQFYKDWYRPNLMAVIAVGDIDPDVMEQKIKERFGRLTNPKKPKERTFYKVPDHDETLTSVVTDKEAAFTRIQLVYKKDNKPTETLADFKRDMTYLLYTGMLNQRLDELKRAAEPPFIYANTGFGSMVRTKDNYTSFAVVGADGIKKGLMTLVIENERAKRFGFTKGELERFKKIVINSLEKAMKEADKTESEDYADEYIRNFLSAEPIPGIDFEYNFYKDVLPSISLNEVNQLGKQWIGKTNRVVVITGPEKEGITMPTEEQVNKMIREATLAHIEPYEDKLIPTSLMEAQPQPGKVTETKTLKTVEATELILSNGLKVVLKSTDFKNDEIFMEAFSYGGESLYELTDEQTAANAASVIAEGGVKDLSPTDIRKVLSGKTVNAGPYINRLSEGVSGSTSPEDIEIMLQLVHLYFTSPRKDRESFESFKSKNAMLLQNLMANPQFFYTDQLSKIMTDDHPRGERFPTPEDLEKIDFNRAHEIYKERFQDAADFTFFFVGSFDQEKLVPLLEAYLGSLPSIGSKEEWRDLGVRPPKGVVNKVLNKGTDQKSDVTVVFTGEKTYAKKENYHLRSLGEHLTNRLIEVLREDKSGVYGVNAQGSASKYPYENYSFVVSFSCGPENVDELVKAVFDEIDKIKEDGISAEDLTKITETQKRDRKDRLKENKFWISALKSYYFNGTDLDTFYEYEEQMKKLAAKDIQNAAREYLKEDAYIKVILMPEE